jgi:hypothetical protein
MEKDRMRNAEWKKTECGMRNAECGMRNERAKGMEYRAELVVD